MIVAKSKLEDPGIGPRTSLMQSERSTTSANPPTTKIKAYRLFDRYPQNSWREIRKWLLQNQNWKIQVSVPVPLRC